MIINNGLRIKIPIYDENINQNELYLKEINKNKNNKYVVIFICLIIIILIIGNLINNIKVD